MAAMADSVPVLLLGPYPEAKYADKHLKRTRVYLCSGNGSPLWWMRPLIVWESKDTTLATAEPGALNYHLGLSRFRSFKPREETHVAS